VYYHAHGRGFRVKGSADHLCGIATSEQQVAGPSALEAGGSGGGRIRVCAD
jgi:hypothetical protein